jgi:hypothetical protein
MVKAMAPLLLVGTKDGLRRLDEAGRWSRSLESKEVHALAADADGWWAVADGSELWWGSPTFDWEPRASFPGGRLNCVLVSSTGVLVGASEARLLRLDGDALGEVESFQQADGRDEWYTPWGGPPDVRSMAEDSDDGTIYVNVHVGGVVRSRDGGATWEPTMDIDADVHQVVAPPASGTVLAASAWGLGGSTDRADSWVFEEEGLHGSYLRSVAMSATGPLFVGASEGHMGRRSAVYRQGRGTGAFHRCGNGVFEWFGSNIDTFCLVARENEVAFGTEDGAVYWSEDEGESWQQVASGLPAVRCVAFA